MELNYLISISLHTNSYSMKRLILLFFLVLYVVSTWGQNDTSNLLVPSISRANEYTSSDSIKETIICTCINNSKKEQTSSKKNIWQDNSFLGSFLGALFSGIAAIVVFLATIWIAYRDKKRKNKTSIAVIRDLLKESIRYIDAFIIDIQDITIIYNKIECGEDNDTPLPYREPYSIKRLKDFNLEYFSELMSTKKINNFPELIINIDHIYLFISELNHLYCNYEIEIKKEFEKKEGSYKQNIIDIYKILVSDAASNIEELQVTRKLFQNIEEQLKK